LVGGNENFTGIRVGRLEHEVGEFGWEQRRLTAELKAVVASPVMTRWRVSLAMRVAVGHSSWNRFTAELPNQCWQADVTQLRRRGMAGL
jgi:transposase InsO family protein